MYEVPDERGRVRVLVAIEPRSYGQVIGKALQKLRPHLFVVVVEPENLLSEAERLCPELLFSHLSGPEMPVDGVGAWVELSVEPGRPSRACVNGRVKEFEDTDLDDLLALVDESERQSREPAGSLLTDRPAHDGRPRASGEY